MASKLRSIARNCARRAMKAQGQAHLNKKIPDLELPPAIERRRHRERRGSTLPRWDSRFSMGWREGLIDHVKAMQGIVAARETAEAAKERRKAKRKTARKRKREAIV